MNRQIRFFSTTTAKNLVFKNFGIILAVGVIITLPTLLISTISQFAVLVNEVALENYILDDAIFSTDLFSIFLPLLGFILFSTLISVILYPIQVGAVQIYRKMLNNTSPKISEVFEVYSDTTKVKTSLKIMISIFLRRLIPTVLFVVSILFMTYFTFIILALYHSIFQLIIFYIITLLAFALLIYSIYLFNKLQMLEIYSMDTAFNENFSVKKAKNEMNFAFKSHKFDIFVYPYTFFPFILLSMLTSFISFGISTIIYTAYYTIATMIYMKTTIDIAQKETFKGEY